MYYVTVRGFVARNVTLRNNYQLSIRRSVHYELEFTQLYKQNSMDIITN